MPNPNPSSKWGNQAVPLWLYRYHSPSLKEEVNGSLIDPMKHGGPVQISTGYTNDVNWYHPKIYFTSFQLNI